MKRIVSILAAFALTSLLSLARASTLYWDGTSGNISTNGDGLSQGGAGAWNTTVQNWDQGAAPHIAWDNSQNYDAYFAGTAGVVTLGAAISANTLTFDTATGYVITDGSNPANTLTLAGTTNLASATLGANVLNSTTFSTAGGGTLILTNTSPGLTGALAVNGGTLQFGAGAATSPGPSGFGNVTVAQGATLRLNPGTTAAYAQSVSGAGSLYVQANSLSSTVTVSGNSTYTGNTTVNQVTVSVPSLSDTVANPLGLGTNLNLCIGNSTSELTYTGFGDTTARALTLSGGAAAGKFINANGFGPLLWLGPVILANANRHILTLSGTATYVNIFGGNIPDNTTTNTVVSKAGAGTWMLAGSNSYSGGTLIGGGTVLITNDNGLGAAAGPIIFSANATLKSTNANVTLNAQRTLVISNTFTATLGVSDANDLQVAAFITGPGAVTKASSSFSLGWLRFSNDTNNYTGDLLLGFGNTEFTSLADQGVASSLGAGATATGGKITLGNSSSAGTLRYVGTGNSATHRPLSWTASTGGYTLDNTNTGTIAYLNTAQMVAGAGSKTLTLAGNNTGANTLAQGVGDNGGVTSLTKTGSGKWLLAGANSYNGITTVSGGTLSVSADGNLGAVPASPTNNLVLNGGALSAAASFTLNANRGIALGAAGAIDVVAGQTLTYAGVITNGASVSNGNLAKTGAGTLTLSGTSTYSGDTLVAGGTLALSGSGSFADSTDISVAAGAALDVSGVGGGYTLGAAQTLLATNGAVATLTGNLNLGSASLTLTNIPHTATILVTGGTLTLSAANPVTVNLNNGGSGLGAGTYKLIAKGAGGAVAGTAPSVVTVGGDGLAGSATAALDISGGELFLVVTGGTLYAPVVESFGFGGGGAVLSFSGTNGQSWKILTTTNLSKPLTNWDLVTSGTFSGTTVNYTNTSLVDPQRYYRIASP